jgi:hypothetical protein
MSDLILDLDTSILQQLLEVLILQPWGTHDIAKGKATPTAPLIAGEGHPYRLIVCDLSWCKI